MKQITALVKAHPYFSSYLLVYILLQIGLIEHSGFQFAPALFFLFFTPFCIVYAFLSNKLVFKLEWFNTKKNIAHLEWILLAIATSGMLVHLFWIGKIPFIEAWSATKLSEANQIRKLASAALPRWLLYTSTWVIRAVIPVVIVMFLKKKNKLGLALSLVMGACYALALMQKSLVLWVMLPAIVYLFLNKKWLTAILFFSMMAVLFLLAVYANNPQLHGGQNDLNNSTVQKTKTNQVSEGLFKRIFIVPGKTLSLWFEHVPKDKPFLYGRDSKIITYFTHAQAADYNLELYPIFYPAYAKQGVKGSVNTAHFMRTYANLGWWGLTIAAILLAFFFAFLNNVHRKTQGSLAYSLQIFPLILLSSGSLFTLLFSGGWGLIIMLLLVLPND